MNKRFTHILFFAQRTRHLSLVILLLLTLSARAQMVQYPVHVQVAMIPPYSLYMEEYSGGMRDRVVVTLINRDNEYFNLRVKLKMTIKANGLTVSTRPNIYLPAIEIDPNIPLRLTKTDLAPYFQPGNYTASGATAILRQKGMLPEGMVQFEFEVQEYTTGRTLSQTGMAMAYIVTQKPPLLNVPNNGIDVLGTNPQNISFQWTPQHSGLANVEYELIVKQLLAPNTRAETQWPYATEIFREPVRANMYYYGPAAPMLTPGYKYAWAVQAKAMEGTEQLNVFQNEGLSEIRWFYLQEQCTPAYNLTAEMNNGRVLLKWNSPPDNTKSIVQYRRIEEGVTNEWLTMGETDKSQMKQDRHKEGYTYEYRIGSVCMTNTPFYDHTSLKFTVPLSDTIQNPHCGEDFVVVYKTREPLQELKPGDEVSGGGGATLYIMTVTSTTPGVFSGTAYTIMSPMWGGAKLRMTFENVTINTDYQLMDGEFVAVKNWKRPQITNLNPQKEEPTFAGNQGITIKEVAFTIPDDASFMFDKSTGMITVNVDGQPIGTIALEQPTATDETALNVWTSTFPITIKDANGNTRTLSEEDFKNENVANEAGENTKNPESTSNINTNTSNSSSIAFSITPSATQIMYGKQQEIQYEVSHDLSNIENSTIEFIQGNPNHTNTHTLSSIQKYDEGLQKNVFRVSYTPSTSAYPEIGTHTFVFRLKQNDKQLGEASVNLEILPKYEILDLTASDHANSKRVAAKGETLYLVGNSGDRTIDYTCKTINRPKDISPLDDIYWSIDETPQQYFGETYQKKGNNWPSGNGSNKNSIKAYNTSGSLNVNVEWLKENRRTLSMDAPFGLNKSLKGVEQYFNSIANFLNKNPLVKVEPQSNIEFSDLGYNKEDPNSRLYIMIRESGAEGSVGISVKDIPIPGFNYTVSNVLSIGAYLSMEMGAKLGGAFIYECPLGSDKYTYKSNNFSTSIYGSASAGVKAELFPGVSVVNVNVKGYASSSISGEVKFCNKNGEIKYKTNIELEPLSLNIEGQVTISTFKIVNIKEKWRISNPLDLGCVGNCDDC